MLRQGSATLRVANEHTMVTAGFDIVHQPFTWTRMDRGEIEVVVSAPGIVIEKADGNFDRQCSASNAPANYVIIQQDDGLFAYYWHMKAGSVTSAAVGQRVQEGEYLGLVGSSGSSTEPHLHFELRDEGGAVVDPFAGQCGASTSLWKHQWPAHADARLTEVASSSPQPVFAGGCSASISDSPNYKNVFNPAKPYLRGRPFGTNAHKSGWDNASLIATVGASIIIESAVLIIYGARVQTNAVGYQWEL